MSDETNTDPDDRTQLEFVRGRRIHEDDLMNAVRDLIETKGQHPPADHAGAEESPGTDIDMLEVAAEIAQDHTDLKNELRNLVEQWRDEAYEYEMQRTSGDDDAPSMVRVKCADGLEEVLEDD